MKLKTFTLRTNLLSKLLLSLALLIGSADVWADELTINNVTSNSQSFFPVYGGSLNTYFVESEHIIQKSLINSTLANKNITGLTFYSSSSNISWGAALFSVVLKEVDENGYSSSQAPLGKEGATQVYSGSLSINADGELTISFSSPFLYSGEKNLLIGVYCTTKGTKQSASFYGAADYTNYPTYYKASAASKSSAVLKTKITYETPSAGGVPAPTSFSATDITYESASLVWTENGTATQWQIKYNAEEDIDPDAAGTEVAEYPTMANPYTLTGLLENKTYYAYVRAYTGSGPSEWTKCSFKTPEQYPTPTDLTASNYAGEGTNATITWIDGEGETPSSWQLRYSSSDFSPAGGEGELIDNIDDNTSTLTGLTPGETYYVAVRACYGEGLYSSWTDKISFTTVAAWETFSDGIPSTWYNQDNHWRTNRSGYEGKASATSNNIVLRTPRLYAEAGQTISFDVTVNSGSLTARYYKNSRNDYSTIGTYTTSGTQTFTAPSTGYYWLQFLGYNCAIDNINGFGPSDTEHLMELGSKTMSSTGTVGGDYTARVNIRELGGTGETFTAELWYDGDKVAELDDQVIAGNRDMEVQLTFTPMEEKSSKPMYAKIIYDGGTQELTTTTTNVTFSNTEYVLDEDSEDRPASSVYARVVQFKYTAKNGWNTICVPFILNDTYLNQIFGSDWKAYTFSGYSDGVISFQKKSSSFAVSTPYLVYAENADDVDENKIYLKSASINTSNYSSGNMTQTKGGATFQGTLDTKYYEAEDNWYGVTPAGKIMKAGTGAYVKGYRAYFTGVSAPASGGDVKMFIIGGDDIPTDLGFVKMVDENAKEVYNLAGQKVQKGRKGIYIVNGKKVVIK